MDESLALSEQSGERHEVGCDRRHSRRQACRATPTTEQAANPDSRAETTREPVSRPISQPRPIPRETARGAIEDELLTSVPPLVGVGLGLAVLLLHPFWMVVAFLAAQPFLFAACCVAGLGWSRVKRPGAAIAVFAARFLLALAAFATVGAGLAGGSGYTSSDGSHLGGSNFDPRIPFTVTMFVATAFSLASALAVSRYATRRGEHVEE